MSKNLWNVKIQLPDYWVCFDRIDESTCISINRHFKKRSVHIIKFQNRTMSIDFSKVLYIEFNPVE